MQFVDDKGVMDYVWATSWGVSTRLMGAWIMAHSDDNGLVIPPKIAPLHVVFVPIYKSAEELQAVADAVRPLVEQLKAKGLQVRFDDRDNVKPGFKFHEHELHGVPVRVAIGPRDLASGMAEVARRDTLEKLPIPQAELGERIPQLLEEIQDNIYRRALEYQQSHITRVDSYEEFKEVLEGKGGFISAHWDGTPETEALIKEETKATIRCIPLDTPQEDGVCIRTGKPSKERVLFARAY